MNRPWRTAAWALAAFLVVLAQLWLAFGADARPMPQEPPRRLSDVACQPMPMMIRVSAQGGLEVSIVDENGCIIGWIRWQPMVKAR